jgi:hypothetical protein
MNNPPSPYYLQSGKEGTTNSELKAGLAILYRKERRERTDYLLDSTFHFQAR